MYLTSCVENKCPEDLQDSVYMYINIVTCQLVIIYYAISGVINGLYKINNFDKTIKCLNVSISMSKNQGITPIWLAIRNRFFSAISPSLPIINGREVMWGDD